MEKAYKSKFSTIIYEIEKLVSFNEKYDIIVFSHLRWDSVFQRPQHLLTKFAKDKKILFVEESMMPQKPTTQKAKSYLAHKNILVIEPYINLDTSPADYVKLLKKYITKFKVKNPVLWFYSPMFAKIINQLEHKAVIYDCMDQLSNFKFAPPELIIQEKYLMSKADLVFTGGRSLYENKARMHPDTFCFPSSVDRKHFNSKKNIITPRDIQKITKPIVIFYGVLDERINLNLIKKIARIMPSISFVMIGPVVKINESDLPKAKNIHYLGKKSYLDLPKYLKAADIAMMPFALNEATEFISPTKTLEYMAAGKPIISTPIKDVVRDYKKVITIVNDELEFKNAVKKYLKENKTQKLIRIEKYNKVLDKTSWSATASQMGEHIENILKVKKLTEKKIIKLSNISTILKNKNPNYNFDL